MKNEISFKASDALLDIIKKWQNWLMHERKYSAHTCDAYFRNLSSFLSFTSDTIKKSPDIKTLENYSVRQFRSFISHLNDRHLERGSIARQLSTLRKFFKWLDINDYAKSWSLSIINSPRLPKLLPKSHDANQIFNVLDAAVDIQKKDWQGLRDNAIFTILFNFKSSYCHK